VRTQSSSRRKIPYPSITESYSLPSPEQVEQYLLGKQWSKFRL